MPGGRLWVVYVNNFEGEYKHPYLQLNGFYTLDPLKQHFCYYQIASSDEA